MRTKTRIIREQTCGQCAGDDAWYSDGWSEKQFDTQQAASKCLGWIGSNPLDQAGNDEGDAINGNCFDMEKLTTNHTCS